MPVILYGKTYTIFHIQTKLEANDDKTFDRKYQKNVRDNVLASFPPSWSADDAVLLMMQCATNMNTLLYLDLRGLKLKTTRGPH